MLNSKSRIVLSSLSALGLIGAGVAAHHVDADLFNGSSDVKTPTVKAESKQISDSKKSEVKSATTYSAPAATIGSTIGSEVASILENEITFMIMMIRLNKMLNPLLNLNQSIKLMLVNLNKMLNLLLNLKLIIEKQILCQIFHQQQNQ